MTRATTTMTAPPIDPKMAKRSAEPTADWNAVWSAMQELGAAIGPLLELSSPPSWAVTMQFTMDVALPDIEEHCAEAEAEAHD